MTTEDFKIEGFKRQIELIKENKELDGNITRPEIADLERSIRLIEWGKQQATKEILVLIDKWEQEHYMELTEIDRYINKEDIRELKQQLKKLGEERNVR